MRLAACLCTHKRIKSRDVNPLPCISKAYSRRARIVGAPSGWRFWWCSGWLSSGWGWLPSGWGWLSSGWGWLSSPCSKHLPKSFNTCAGGGVDGGLAVFLGASPSSAVVAPKSAELLTRFKRQGFETHTIAEGFGVSTYAIARRLARRRPKPRLLEPKMATEIVSSKP